MNRRGFLKEAAGAVAGAFIVPEVIVPERRVWALDSTMIRSGRVPGHVFGLDKDQDIYWSWCKALEPWNTPVLNYLPPYIEPPSVVQWGSPFDHHGQGLTRYLTTNTQPGALLTIDEFDSIMQEVWDSFAK